jgi:hypothetical protein
MQAQTHNGSVAEATTNSFSVGNDAPYFAMVANDTGYRLSVRKGATL